MFNKIYIFLTIIIFSLLFIDCSDVDDFSEDSSAINDTIDTNGFEVTLDFQILKLYTPTRILKIIDEHDGYLIFTEEIVSNDDINSIRIIKIDNDFNEKWSFLINETNYYEDLYGVFELTNGEYLAVLNTVKNYLGVIRSEVYGLKFSSSGTVLLKKSYLNPRNFDSYVSHDMPIYFENNSNELKFMVISDSLYNNSEQRQYYNELTVDKNFNVLKEKILPFNTSSKYEFGQMIYNIFGNKYVYGNKWVLDYQIGNTKYGSLQAVLIKYGLENNQFYSNEFGEKKKDENFSKVLIDNNKIIAIGEHSNANNDYAYHRWITQIDENGGNIIWEIKQDNKLFTGIYSSYVGIDIIKDIDSNYLALFAEGSSNEKCSTLIKIDDKGKILWTITDTNDENYNSYSFYPCKIFIRNNEYLIFGMEKDNKLWVKKIKKL